MSQFIGSRLQQIRPRRSSREFNRTHHLCHLVADIDHGHVRRFSLLWLLRDRLQGDQVSNFRAGHAHAGVLVILTLVVVDIADRAGASGQRLWMIAAALFIFALAQSGGFFIALGNRQLGRVVTTVAAIGLAATVVIAAVWLLMNA